MGRAMRFAETPAVTVRQKREAAASEREPRKVIDDSPPTARTRRQVRLKQQRTR
jgi:hypothetical protein